MFTLQVGQLNGLSPHLPPEAIDLLREIFGQCEQQLAHRGPVDLTLPPHIAQAAMPQSFGTLPVGNKPIAAFTVENRASQYNEFSQQVNGGWAIHATGVSSFDTIVANKVITTEINNDQITASRTIPVVATSAWRYTGRLPSRHGGMAWCEAQTPEGAAVRVWLPVSSGQDPNVEVGQAFHATRVAGSEDYTASGLGDDAVGTIKMTRADNQDLPAGWQLVPGPLNTDGAYVRGTTLDAGQSVGNVDKMDPAPRPAGGTSGDTRYMVPGLDVGLLASRLSDHPTVYTSSEWVSVQVAPHQGRTETATTGIDIPPHGSHTHPTYTYHVQACNGYDGGYNEYDACITIRTSYGPNQQPLEHAINEPNAGVGTGHSHALPPLEHQVTSQPHAHLTPALKHYGTGKMESQKVPLAPLAVSLKFIERINNSG